MPFEPTYATVHNEGCDIRYWHQGSENKKLLILVPGGGGIGKQYNHLFEHLADEYHVCTLDRRQNGGSKVDPNKHTFLNPAQQARDVIAVMKALGYEKMHYYGNSGGGIIGLTLAVMYPQHLTHIISHEAPTIALLPDAVNLVEWTYETLALYKAKGSVAAFDNFGAMLTGYEGLGPNAEPSRDDKSNFWEYEYIVFNTWCPDLRRIPTNGVSIAVAAGKDSKDAWYARTVKEHQAIMQCPYYVFPGPHTGFWYYPKEFAQSLKQVFSDLEASK